MPRLAPLAALMLAACPIVAVVDVAAQPERDALLARIGAYIEAYYTRAQSLLTEETVTMQALARDLTQDGFARRLVYEVRFEWDPESSVPATSVRQLLRVNGRPPRERDEPKCTDPRTLSPEPLAPLLPANQPQYVFTLVGVGSVDRRPAAMIDFVQAEREVPKVEWQDTCAHIELPGRTRTRVWADAQTGEVLRLDEHLLGPVDIQVPPEQQRLGGSRYMTIERADMSVRYTPVVFRDPEERLLLPSRIETLVIVQNSGTPRMRITQEFEGYRRFVTESRVVH